MLESSKLTLSSIESPNKREIQKSGLPNFFYSKLKCKRRNFVIACFELRHSKKNLSFSYSLLSQRETQLKLMLCRVDHIKVVPPEPFLRNIIVEVKDSARSDICCVLQPYIYRGVFLGRFGICIH